MITATTKSRWRLPIEVHPERAESTIIFQGPGITIGLWSAGSHAPVWDRELVIEGPHIAFPHSVALIRQADRGSVIADPNSVVVYNDRQVYRRSHVNGRPHVAVWICLSPAAIAEILGPARPGLRDHPDRPFDRATLPCSVENYLNQLAVVRSLLVEDRRAETLDVTERVFQLVASVLSVQPPARPPRDRIEALKAALSRRIEASASLEEVSADAGVSPFHACRIFKEACGMTMHQYLTQLRLRSAAICLADNRESLTSIALRHGFSSHAHFSDVFRRRFGVTPSTFRRDPWAWRSSCGAQRN